MMVVSQYRTEVSHRRPTPLQMKQGAGQAGFPGAPPAPPVPPAPPAPPVPPAPPAPEPPEPEAPPPPSRDAVPLPHAAIARQATASSAAGLTWPPARGGSDRRRAPAAGGRDRHPARRRPPERPP